MNKIYFSYAVPSNISPEQIIFLKKRFQTNSDFQFCKICQKFDRLKSNLFSACHPTITKSVLQKQILNLNVFKDG